MIRYLIPVLLFPILSLLPGMPSLAQDGKPFVSVSGSAEVRVAPDQVVLTAAVESRSAALAEAAAENELKIKQLLEFLQSSGVAANNVRTEFINIQPIFPQKNYPPFGKQQMEMPSNAAQMPRPVDGELEKLIQPIGYQVRRQFRIRITDLNTFETIYKGLIENGVNKIDGFQFESSELRKHRDEARLKAVKAAREKAEAMAKELGATLASIRSIQEVDDRFSTPAFQNSISAPRFDGGVDNGGSYATGLISINAQVSVVFGLGNTKLEANEE
jgi:uncharacterized protein YggE